MDGTNVHSVPTTMALVHRCELDQGTLTTTETCTVTTTFQTLEIPQVCTFHTCSFLKTLKISKCYYFFGNWEPDLCLFFLSCKVGVSLLNALGNLSFAIKS